MKSPIKERFFLSTEHEHGLVRDYDYFDTQQTVEVKLSEYSSCEEKQLRLFVCNSILGDHPVIISNRSTVNTFKLAYLALVGEERVMRKRADTSKLRFSCQSKWLIDDQFLYSYDLQEGMTV